LQHLKELVLAWGRFFLLERLPSSVSWFER